MPAVARGLGRLRQMQRALLGRARCEANQGNLLKAAILLAVYAVAL
jgi:hypothetical protein